MKGKHKKGEYSLGVSAGFRRKLMGSDFEPVNPNPIYWPARDGEPTEDPRDLTGRLCGDPLPERSALAQRGARS